MKTVTTQKIIALADVTVQYRGVTALDSVSVEINAGELVAIMGPNGAGKSTVLKAMFGLAPITHGQVLLHEKLIHPITHEMVQRGISFVPQGRRVFTQLTVEENIMMGAFALRLPRAEASLRRDELFDLFPILKEKRRDYSGNLSGGQQQLLAIARGLMTRPQVLLLDEPTLGLSPKMVKEVLTQVHKINEEQNTAIVVVEHNIKTLLELADRAYLLAHGRVAAHGEPKKLLQTDILERVFLGK